MTTTEIYERLTQIFRDVLEEDDLLLRPDMTASEVDAWDSLNHVRLILAVQKEFGIKLSAASVANLKNVGDLASLVQNRVAPK